MHILLMKLSSIGWNETIFNETKNQIMHPRHQFECCGHICNDQYYYQAILLLKQNRYSFVFIEAFRNVSCTTPSESIRATSFWVCTPCFIGNIQYQMGEMITIVKFYLDISRLKCKHSLTHPPSSQLTYMVFALI